jgi:hypothetical protein
MERLRNVTNPLDIPQTKIPRTRNDWGDLLVSNTLPGYRSFSRSLSPAEISLPSRDVPIEIEDSAFVEGDDGVTKDDRVFDGES